MKALVLQLATILSSTVWGQGHVDYMFDHGRYHPVPAKDKNLGNHVIYQVVIDRFSNGTSANDCVDQGRYCSRPGGDWYKYWGGDLKGLTQRLDYLKRLGVDMVWMTPIFENQPIAVSFESAGQRFEVSSYHGYWIRDWYRLNPHFTNQGSQDYQAIRDLIEAAGTDIQFLLDTVLNHTSPKNPTPESLRYAEKAMPLPEAHQHASHRGALFQNGTYLTSISEDEIRRTTEQGYKSWFHHFPNITDWGNPFQVENYSLAGLADLDQTNPQLQRYFLHSHSYWLQSFPQIAGYRVDTIKHVPHWFWRGFMKEFSGRHPNKAMIGEYFGGGPKNRDSYPLYNETHMTMFDFDFRSAIEAIYLRDSSLETLVDLWRHDDNLADARGLVTFIDNHDLKRLRGSGMSRSQMVQALALMFASRGVPCLYYGIEQDLFFPGDPGDPYNRPMMQQFDESTIMFRYTQALAHYRRAHDSLRYGSTHVVHATRHILGFERIHEDDGVFFAMSTNRRTDAFEMRGLRLRDGLYRDPFSGQHYRVRDGRVRVELSEGKFIMFSEQDRIR